MAGETETRLKISAVDTSAKAFRDVAAAVEAMTQRVTKSQRVLVDSHKQTAATLASLTSLGKESLKTLGVGFGTAEAVSIAKAAVVAFAGLDKQARQTSLNLGVSKEAMESYYAEVGELAEKMGGVAQEYRTAFDSLAQAFGPEKAKAIVAPVAAAATETGSSIADTALLATQMVETYQISLAELPAALDTWASAAQRAGSRINSGPLAQGLQQLSQDAAQIGERGTDGFTRISAALETVATKAPSAEAAIASVQTMLEGVGKKKFEPNFARVGINITEQLAQAGREGKDQFEVLVTEARKAAEEYVREFGGTLGAAYRELFKDTGQGFETLNDQAADYRKLLNDLRSDTAKGTVDRGLQTMLNGTSASLARLSEQWEETKLVIGKGLVDVGVIDGLKQISAGIKSSTEEFNKLKDAAEWIWGKVTHPLTDAEKRPDLAAKGPLPTGSRGGPISGNLSDIPWMGARPLIPSEPGSSTERTAREQLEAIRRLERAAMWGGWFGGTAAGSTPATGGGGGGTGGGGAASGTPGSRQGGPGGGKPLPAGGGTPAGPSEPAGKGGYRGGATPHNLDVFMAAAEDQLRKEGVPEANVHAAASVLAGNAIQESKLNPKAVHDQGTGYGIYGARLGRRDKMLAWLSKNGYAKDSLEGQAKYMAHEGMAGGYPATRRALMGASGGNLGTATSTTMREFEAPKAGPGAGESNRRGAASTAFGSHHEPPPIAAARNPQHESQLEDFRRQAAKPVRVKVAYAYEDVRGIRDRGEAQGRRTFNREAKRSRYASFSDVGVV